MPCAASKSSTESVGDDHDRTTIIEVFENGTLMGAVVPEPLQPIADSANRSSVITLTSAMLNFHSNGGVVTCDNNTSMSSGDNCSVLAVDAPNNTSSISGMLSQAEYLNSSDTCSSTLESNARRNSKRSSSQRKSKKCAGPAEIFVNPCPPPYTTICVEAGVGGAGNQPSATAAGAAVVSVSAGFENPIGSYNSGHLTVQLPVMRRSSPEPPRKVWCDLCVLPFPLVLGILSLSGVACTVGGIVLGSAGIIEHSTQYLSAALIMMGIGLSLLVITCAMYRYGYGEDSEPYQCFQPSFDTCRNCNSPYCANRFLTGAYFYPEFQHRQPPPSYMTTSQDYRLLVPDQTNNANSYDSQRNLSPPPSYRSYSTTTLSSPSPDQNQTTDHAANMSQELNKSTSET